MTVIKNKSQEKHIKNVNMNDKNLISYPQDMN